MTWLKIDDGMPEHSKIADLSVHAKWALVEIWCYSARNHTDGKLPLTIAKRITSAKVLAELTDADLIHKNGAGWIVHDFLDYNPSKSEVDERREAEAERLRTWRNRKRETADET